jgi:hypothetical protein
MGIRLFNPKVKKHLIYEQLSKQELEIFFYVAKMKSEMVVNKESYAFKIYKEQMNEKHNMDR